MAIRGCIEHRSEHLIEGWCFDDTAPTQALDVVLCVGGEAEQRVCADLYRKDLADCGYGTGHHGFQLHGRWPNEALDPAALDIRVVGADGDAIRLPILGHDDVQRGGTEPALPPSCTPKGRRLARCILHIGLEKAGSSGLQRFFAINRAALLDRGYLVPLSLALNGGRDLTNHAALTAYALDAAKATEAIRALFGTRSATEVGQFRSQTCAALAQEIDAAPAHVETLVLSNEHLHSRLREPSEIQRLWHFLSVFCEAIEVVVYLRPQHRIAVSAHSTLVKNGSLQETPFPRLVAEAPWVERELRAYYDYDALVQRWASVFGAAHVKPVILTKPIETHWLASESLSLEGLTPLSERVNVGLSAGGLALLRRLNAELVTLPAGRAQQIRDALIPLLEQHYDGFGAVGHQTEAIAFQSLFEDSNAQLRVRYFPDQSSLFDADFSSYRAARQDPTATDGAGALVTALLRFFLHDADEGSTGPTASEPQVD